MTGVNSGQRQETPKRPSVRVRPQWREGRVGRSSRNEEQLLDPAHHHYWDGSPSNGTTLWYLARHFNNVELRRGEEAALKETLDHIDVTPPLHRPYLSDAATTTARPEPLEGSG